MARSTFRSQNVQNTPRSDHFWTFRARFAWQAQGIVHLVKSEQNVRVLWPPLHHTTLQYTTLQLQLHLHYIPLHYTPLHPLHSTTLHSITLNYTTLHYTKLGTRLTGGREEFSTPAMLSICFSADLQWSEHSSPFWIFHAAVPLVKAASSRN